MSATVTHRDTGERCHTGHYDGPPDEQGHATIGALCVLCSCGKYYRPADFVAHRTEAPAAATRAVYAVAESACVCGHVNKWHTLSQPHPCQECSCRGFTPIAPGEPLNPEQMVGLDTIRERQALREISSSHARLRDLRYPGTGDCCCEWCDAARDSAPPTKTPKWERYRLAELRRDRDRIDALERKIAAGDWVTLLPEVGGAVVWDGNRPAESAPTLRLALDHALGLV